MGIRIVSLNYKIEISPTMSIKLPYGQKKKKAVNMVTSLMLSLICLTLLSSSVLANKVTTTDYNDQD